MIITDFFSVEADLQSAYNGPITAPIQRWLTAAAKQFWGGELQSQLKSILLPYIRNRAPFRTGRLRNSAFVAGIPRAVGTDLWVGLVGYGFRAPYASVDKRVGYLLRRDRGVYPRMARAINRALANSLTQNRHLAGS